MRRWLPLAALVSLLSACGSSEANSATSAQELLEEGATLVDVRTPAEHAEAHLEGTLNVPVDELLPRLSELPKDKPVIVYCRSGRRSARAAALLRRQGFEVHDAGPMSALVASVRAGSGPRLVRSGAL